MHSTEKLNAKHGAMKLLVHNLQKLELLLQERGLVSLKSQERWVKAKHITAVRQEELEAARSWSEVCRNKLKQRKTIKREIEQECLWVDTTALCGFHQRYRTENLRRRIYDLYFQSLCEHIVIRAEIVATERQLMRIQEGLMTNQAEMLLKVRRCGPKQLEHSTHWWSRELTVIWHHRQRGCSRCGGNSRPTRCCVCGVLRLAGSCLESGKCPFCATRSAAGRATSNGSVVIGRRFSSNTSCCATKSTCRERMRNNCFRCSHNPVLLPQPLTVQRQLLV
jgi:hypothetical protein